MPDDLTVLTSTNGAMLGKSFSGPGLVAERFSAGFEFQTSEVLVDGLASMAAELQSLERRGDQLVIRGKPLSAGTSPVRRDKQFFVGASRQWCMIDIDDLEWFDSTDDHNQLIAYAKSSLPPEFQTVDCWYQFSSSMGIKSGIRVHLWYWLDRACSDDEMNLWLKGYIVDFKMFNPVQIHSTAAPQFKNGAVDPFPSRSGMFLAGQGATAVAVPSDLDTRTQTDLIAIRTRVKTKSNMLEPAEIVRDPSTGLAIDGREQLMFLLSNEVTAALTTKAHKPTENEIADALWDRFAQEADLTVINGQEWSKADALVKAKDRVRELSNGSFSFVSRSDRTKLMPGRKDVPRPTLLEAQKAQAELDKILSDFFGELSKGLIPRSTVRITMGVGKTAGAIEKLKAYLKGRIGQLVEIYVPQHHLGRDWQDMLTASSKGNLAVNAKVVRVLPRTGGQLDTGTKTYVHPVLCQRADYVRDLERNGHAIYSNACLSQSANARCIYFDQCEYLDQFRPADGSADNIVRIYTHTTLFQNRNEFERQKAPNLVIIDESFVASAVSDMPAIKTNDIIAHVRTATNPQLGFDLVEGLRAHHGELSYLRDKGFDGSDFSAVYLEAFNPKQPFSAQSLSSVGTKSAKLYKALSRLRDLAVQELNDEGKSAFEQLSFDGKNDQVDGKSDQVVLCEHREIRVNGSTPVLYLDATADPLITEAYLPGLRHHVVDVRQLAVVSQVTDRTGSNTSWNERIPAEKANLAAPTYDPSNNDISSLIQVLNSWVQAGEKPLLVAHKALADYIKAHPKRAEGVSVAHFMSLRGSNDYEDCSVIFVTGRNQ